ncbi:MAG: N-(5'-phosphoribosyl)anthranilate isomerase [Pseudomonadota bacterium]
MTLTAQDIWLHQLFSAKAVNKGGVLRRAKHDVARNIGLEQLILEVKRRGFHMIETDAQLIILCNNGHFRVLC